MITPPMQRRNFLAKLFGAIAGASWLGAKKAEAATTGFEDTYFLGEIRMWAGDFEPAGWRYCDGRLLVIAEYEALFSLIGTTYGGDGQVTFALPDMRGRIPFHPAATSSLGEARGTEAVTLLSTQAPVHSHNPQGSSGVGFSDDPAARIPARNALGSPHYTTDADTSFAPPAVDPSGGSQPHSNMMPSLAINFIIAIEGGVYPQWN